MPALVTGSAERMPRRFRSPIPADPPRHGELVAAFAVAALLAHLLFAQLTLALAVAFCVIGRVSRWRPSWLAVPATAGLLWALAIGPGRAAAGFAAGPRKVAGYLAGVAGRPGHLLHLSRAFVGLDRWLPRQLPLALIVAAAEAGLIWWLGRLRSAEPDPPPSRAGLVVAVRRRYAAAAIRAGGVVTRDGGCLGLDHATGGRAAISWPEAERGVLCVGQDDAALAETGLALAVAAVRRRKAVIAVDLTGSQPLADRMTAACAAAQAPLRRFGETGPACYEPLRGGDPARGVSLVLGMIDWSAISDQHRRTCAAYLNDAFAVIAAAPADPRLPVLDDLSSLLQPAALRSRAARIPGYHPRRAVLADRASVSASLLEADPAAISALATQLPRLRRSALGHWLRPPWIPAAETTRPAAGPPGAGPPGAGLPGAGLPGAGAPGNGEFADDEFADGGFGEPGGGEPTAAGWGARRGSELTISLGQAVRDRMVVLFSLDRGVHGRSASMIAGLAASDLMAVLAELRGLAARGDSLVWINGCEVLDRRLAAELIAQGAETGTAVLLSTGSAATAAQLAGEAGVIVSRGPADPALAGQLAALTGQVPAAGAAGMQAGMAGAPTEVAFRMQAGHHLLAQALTCQGPDEFALLVRGARRRVLPRCLAVPTAGGAP
jgi:hypothetical protein